MTVVAGPYTATWNALAVGNTATGFEHSYAVGARPIQFDSVGETPIDLLINRMVMTVDFVIAEADSAAIATMLWPWHTTKGVFPRSGTSLFSLAKPLILTACDTINPATITFYRTILSPESQQRILYSHRERYIPVQLYCFPVDNVSGPTVQPTGCNATKYFEETLQI